MVLFSRIFLPHGTISYCAVLYCTSRLPQGSNSKIGLDCFVPSHFGLKMQPVGALFGWRPLLFRHGVQGLMASRSDDDDVKDIKHHVRILIN
jgi:hypothetical protein